MKLRSIAVMLLALGGCAVGAPDVRSVPAAMTGAGATGTIDTPSGEVTGELLAVTDSTFVMAGTRIIAVPHAMAKRCKFKPFTYYCADHARLRLVSRFAYGMPAAALQALLAARQQTSLDVVR